MCSFLHTAKAIIPEGHSVSSRNFSHFIAPIAAIVLSACATSSTQSGGGSTISMVGSSSVGPGVASQAEAAGFDVTSTFEGSGAGRNVFCGTSGPGAPDVLILSRALRPEEAADCAANGVSFESNDAANQSVIIRQSSLDAIPALASLL